MSIRAFSGFVVGALLFLQGACSSSPRFQGMTADEIFELGVREFEGEDWDEAIRAFERVIFADPTYPRLVEARMYLARAYFSKEEYITAVSEYTRIMDRHPGHALAPEASLGICRSYAGLSPIVERDQSYTVQAVSACENVILDYGGHEVSLEAGGIRDRLVEKLARKEYNRGDHYFRRKYFDSGIIYFNIVLDEYPQTRAVADALLRLYQSYSEIGWDTEADEAKQRLLSEFPDSDAAREIQANGEERALPEDGVRPDSLAIPDTTRVGMRGGS